MESKSMMQTQQTTIAEGAPVESTELIESTKSAKSIQATSSTPQPTFEQQMARLDKIVRLLEQGEAPLSDSIQLFEEGMQLSAALNQQLNYAEQKVTLMQETAMGELVEQPFTEEGGTL